jgi:hypothetical protein
MLSSTQERIIMADEPNRKGPGIRIATGSSELAPFIYCDGVATYGTNNGIIQLELASNIIVPDGAGTRTDVLIVGHLRCSPAAARGLRDCITKALEMSATNQMIEPVPNSKPH